LLANVCHYVSQELAFDYLRDNYQKDPSTIVMRSGDMHYVIIDEVIHKQPHLLGFQDVNMFSTRYRPNV
jgi:phosphatidylglycerophosphatase A